MRILYRDPETEALTITEVTNTKYSAEDNVLTFFGDDDISISVNQKKADELNRTLFTEGKLDISGYDCDYFEWDEEDEDEDEDFEFVVGPDFLADF